MEITKLKRRAVDLAYAGRYKAAARAYARAFELAPDDASLAMHLAEARRRMGDLQGALEAYVRAGALFKAAGWDSKAEATERLVGELSGRTQETVVRPPLWKRLFGNA